MTSSLLALTLVALPIRVAAPGLSSSEVAAEVVQVSLEHLAQQLSERGLQTQAGARLASTLGPERHSRLFNCVSAACLKELQDALQVDAVLSGTVERRDGALAVALQVRRTADARQVATFEGAAASTAELPELLTRAAQALAEQTWDGFAAPVDDHPGRAIASGLTLGAAIALLGTAAVLYGLSASGNGKLEAGDSSLSARQAFSLTWLGRTEQNVAIGATIAGGIAALACMALVLSSASEPGSHIVLVPTGAGLSVAGAF